MRSSNKSTNSKRNSRGEEHSTHSVRRTQRQIAAVPNAATVQQLTPLSPLCCLPSAADGLVQFEGVVELVESTKLRLYSSLIRSTVARNYLRSFRLRKMIRAIHAHMHRIVGKYISGRGHIVTQEAQQQEQLNQQARRTVQAVGLAAAAVHARPSDAAASTSGSCFSASSVPAPPASTLESGLALPSCLPSLYASPTPELLGSLTTDDPAPCSILTASRALSSGSASATQPGLIALQSEVGSWAHSASNIIRFGRKSGKRPPINSRIDLADTPADKAEMDLRAGSSANSSAARSHRASLREDAPQPAEPASFSSPADPHSQPHPHGSLPDVLASLCDVGPVFRCLCEDLLNSFGAAKSTLQSFVARNAEVTAHTRQQAEQIAQLDRETMQMRAYLQMQIECMAPLTEEINSLRSIEADHAEYEAHLRRTLKTIETIRERASIEQRKAARSEAAMRAHGSGSTGGFGISSSLLASARAARAAEEEARRAALLNEIVREQENSMGTVARSARQLNAQAIRELNPQLFAVGADNKSDAGPSTQVLHPPGIGPLVALLDRSSKPSPHLDAFRERHRASISAGMKARGIDEEDLEATAVGGNKSPQQRQRSTADATSPRSQSQPSQPQSQNSASAPISAAASTPGFPLQAHASPESAASLQEFLRSLPRRAFPSAPPPPAPIVAPVVPVRSSRSTGPRPLLVPTQLIGGLTLASRDRALWKLTQSPYMRSTLMTPDEEMKAIADRPHQAANSARAAQGAGARRPASAAQARSARPSAGHADPPPVSARGSRPLKANPLASAHPRLNIGGGSQSITRQKLAQQKLRIEQSLYEPALFEQPH